MTILSATGMTTVAGSLSSGRVPDTQRAIKITDVGKGYAGTSVNTTIFRNSSVASLGNVQYTAYYDNDGNVVVAKRKLPKGEWELTKTPLKGNIKDGHNGISIGVDGKGFIHLSYDHHGHPLRYAVSSAPGALDFVKKDIMTGVDEGNVTYPEFYRLKNGDLLFAYRSGSSGRGNLVLNRYDVKTKTWSRVQDILIDGENARNAYWQLCLDDKDRIHLSWVWRETWLVETNHDLCYAYSDDYGKTWKNSKGETFELPLTLTNSETAFVIPQKSELINQTGMTADGNGNPYIATYWRDTDSKVPQYRMVWHDKKTGWKSKTVGNRSTPFSLSGGGTKMIPIARPRIIADGKFIGILFRDEERGSKVSLTYSKNGADGDWKTIDLTEFSVGAWEPSFDLDLWKAKKKLHIFVQPSLQGDGEKAVETEPTMVSILELDIDKL